VWAFIVVAVAAVAVTVTVMRLAQRWRLGNPPMAKAAFR
jgi:hypothetical protein